MYDDDVYTAPWIIKNIYKQTWHVVQRPRSPVVMVAVVVTTAADGGWCSGVIVVLVVYNWLPTGVVVAAKAAVAVV